MGIQRNFIFSTILTVANYIFPFLVYPYVARVLGVENMGICNFVDSVINYAMILSSMGIAIVGVREIAKSKSDKENLYKTFTSLFVLCTLFTLAATVILIAITYGLEAFRPYRPLIPIGLIKLWGNFLIIDWLYRGLEDFKYITIRTILVKFGYVLGVFIFVRNSTDYPGYFFIFCMMYAVNALINCIYAAKIVRFRFDRRLTIALLRPFTILGIYILLNSMYTTFNVVYLGLDWDDVEVGYYTTATKIFNIILGIYTAYSGVVMPRASALLSEGNHDGFKELIKKSIQALLLIAVPVVVFGMLYSPGIIYLAAGSQYGGAIVPMTIVMPLIFIIGYEQILVVQTLTPLASDKKMLTISIIGASVGVLGNILLVGHLGAIGSSIVWLTAEIVVMLFAQYFVMKLIGLYFPLRYLLGNILAYVPYILISILIILYIPYDDIIKMLIGAVICLFYFMIIQKYLLKNQIYMHYHDLISAKLKFKRR